MRFGRAGVSRDADGPYPTLLDESDVVPRQVDGVSGIGFVVIPSSAAPYSVYSVHRLPGAPRTVGKSLDLQPDGSFRTRAESAQGACLFSFAFDADDPLGTYGIDVYVDGRLVRSAEIRVVAP